ncbi:hypothetical protein ACTFIY_010519 [Dictyostelium cf. discoideum]
MCTKSFRASVCEAIDSVGRSAAIVSINNVAIGSKYASLADYSRITMLWNSRDFPNNTLKDHDATMKHLEVCALLEYDNQSSKCIIGKIYRYVALHDIAHYQHDHRRMGPYSLVFNLSLLVTLIDAMLVTAVGVNSFNIVNVSVPEGPPFSVT